MQFSFKYGIKIVSIMENSWTQLAGSLELLCTCPRG